MRVQEDLLAKEAPPPPTTSLKPRSRPIWAGAGRVVGGGQPRGPHAVAATSREADGSGGHALVVVLARVSETPARPLAFL